MQFKQALLKYTKSGWTRFEVVEDELIISYPLEILEKVFVCDTETGVNLGGVPNGGSAVLVTVTSSKALYVWIHPSLLDPNIPYEPIYPSVGTDKVIIAHNSAFDVHRIQESLQLSNPVNFWIDTMSLHMVVSGLMSSQRFWFMEKNPKYVPAWASAGCLNSLVDTYNFHVFPDVEISKDIKQGRNIFIEANHISEIAAELDSCLEYAIGDTLLTAELFAHLWPKYRESQPNLAGLFAHMMISSSNIPLADDWLEWAQHCDDLWEQELGEIDAELTRLAVQVWQDWLNGDIEVEADPWLSQLSFEANFQLKKDGTPRSKDWYGVPEFFKKILQKEKHKIGDVYDEDNKVVRSTLPNLGLTTRANVAPLLLRIEYAGRPVAYVKGEGWGTYDDDGEFIKVPHPDGSDSNVGSLFSQDFADLYEDGTLGSNNPHTQAILDKTIGAALWTSIRSRIHGQHVVENWIEIEE